MSERRLSYPLVPKSVEWLLPGQYWALPLSDGTFGCGRVIEVPGHELRNSQMEFLAAVLDWHAQTEPTGEMIAGHPCLTQGRAHIRSITRTGGAILGHRELAADGITPWLFRRADHHRNSSVMRGFVPIRDQRPSDQGLPVLSVWGYLVPQVIADARFVKRTGPWAKP
jgi:hypothetical protein